MFQTAETRRWPIRWPGFLLILALYPILGLAREAPNWEPWLLFFLTALQRQAQRLLTKVERERLLLTNLPELSAQILDYVRGHGRLTIGQAVTLTGASRNTLKIHFRQLVERGLLTLHGHGRGAWYSLL